MDQQMGGETSHHVPSTGLNSMPTEIKRIIIENLCDHCTNFLAVITNAVEPTSRKPLYNLCLVSRSLRDVAQPVLFHLFSHEYEDLWQRSMPFARTIQHDARLAGHVRCIVRPSRRVRKSSLERLSDAVPETLVQEEVGEQLYRSLIMNLVAHTPEIESLDLELGEYYSTDAIHLPKLYLLSLNMDPYARHRDPMQDMAEGCLFAAPDVKVLKLSSWRNSDSIFDDIVIAMPDLHTISIEITPGPEDYGDLEVLAQGLLHLETLSLAGDLSRHEILSQLLPRRDRLTYLTIQEGCVDYRLLANFTNLKQLKLLCDIEHIPQPEAECDGEVVTVGLTHSLEHLMLAHRGRDQVPLALLVRRLSQRLSSYSRLKSFRYGIIMENVDLQFLNYIIDVLGVEEVTGNFVDAGVEAILGETLPSF